MKLIQSNRNIQVLKDKDNVTLEPVFLEKYNDLKELKKCSFEFMGKIHLIKNNTNEIVGAVEYRYMDSLSDVYIELIEILEPHRRKGYAQKTINLIKEMYPKSNIFGQSIPKKTTKNIWIALGADFNSCEEAECPYNSFEECKHHCDTPADYSFGMRSLK